MWHWPHSKCSTVAHGYWHRHWIVQIGNHPDTELLLNMLIQSVGEEMNKWDSECPVWSYLYCDSWPLFCPCLGPPLSMTDSVLSSVVHHWSHCACKLLQEVSLLSPPKWLNSLTLFSKIYQQQLLSVPYPYSWPLAPIRTYFRLTVKSYISFPEDIFFPLEGILLQ